MFTLTIWVVQGFAFPPWMGGKKLFICSHTVLPFFVKKGGIKYSFHSFIKRKHNSIWWMRKGLLYEELEQTNELLCKSLLRALLFWKSSFWKAVSTFCLLDQSKTEMARLALPLGMTSIKNCRLADSSKLTI